MTAAAVTFHLSTSLTTATCTYSETKVVKTERRRCYFTTAASYGTTDQLGHDVTPTRLLTRESERARHIPDPQPANQAARKDGGDVARPNGCPDAAQLTFLHRRRPAANQRGCLPGGWIHGLTGLDRTGRLTTDSPARFTPLVLLVQPEARATLFRIGTVCKKTRKRARSESWMQQNSSSRRRSRTEQQEHG